MSDKETVEKVRKLIRWKDSDPTALLEQAIERVRTALREKRQCGVVLCVIEESAETGGAHYEPACSPLPVESIVMAGEMIKDKAKYEWSHGE